MRKPTSAKEVCLLLKEIQTIYNEYVDDCESVGLRITPRTQLFPHVGKKEKIAIVRLARNLPSETGQCYTFFVIASDFPLSKDCERTERWRKNGNKVFGIYLCPDTFNEVKFLSNTSRYYLSPDQMARSIKRAACPALTKELKKFKGMLRERVDIFVGKRKSSQEGDGR